MCTVHMAGVNGPVWSYVRFDVGRSLCRQMETLWARCEQYISLQSHLSYTYHRCQSVSNIVRVQSPSPIPSPLPSLPLPLEVGPLNQARGVWGSAVSSPSGVWGEAPAANDFGAF